MPESHDFDSIVQMCIGDDVYTTADRVRFAVMFTDGRIGDLVVDIAPGETKGNYILNSLTGRNRTQA